ncbi:MAG: hypothetical protein CMQ24_08425 [Gammaproteobacteria bacterium]|nr:hypothetical protein [Gammaproteobacteria bacterium]
MPGPAPISRHGRTSKRRVRSVDSRTMSSWLLIAQPVQPVCLTCHGKRLAGDVRTAIAEHYRDDRATGYALGDVRGAIYLRKALP